MREKRPCAWYVAKSRPHRRGRAPRANTRGALQTDGKFSRTEYGEDDGGNVGNYVDFDLSDLPTPPVVHFKAQRPKALPDQTYVFAFCGSRSPHALTDVPRVADQTACSMSSMATMC